MADFAGRLRLYRLKQDILNGRISTVASDSGVATNLFFLVYALKNKLVQPHNQFEDNILALITSEKSYTHEYASNEASHTKSGAEKDAYLQQSMIRYDKHLVNAMELEDTLAPHGQTDRAIGRLEGPGESPQQTEVQPQVENIIQDEYERYREDYDIRHLQMVLKLAPEQCSKVGAIIFDSEQDTHGGE